MKNLWLLLVCCLLLGKLTAQTSVGVRGGVSLSRVNFTPAISQTFVSGYEAGLLFRHLNTKHLGIQAELNLSRQGWHIYPADSRAYEKELQYIQLPLLSHVQLGGGRFTFVAQAGGFVAYTFSEKDLKLPLEDAEPGVVYAQQDLLPWQYGVLAAAGPSFRFNFGTLQLEARFAQHLSDLLQVNLNRPDDFDASQQQIITFGLQWLYTF